MPHIHAIPGGIAKIPLGTYQAKPRAHYRDQQLLVFKENNQWYALLGVPLKTRAGLHTVSVHHASDTSTKPFHVDAHTSYQEQRIRLKNRNYVEPDKKTLDRIWRDVKATKRVYTDWQESHNPLAQIPFAPPLKAGIITGLFGTKRYFNDQPRNPHSGIDIAAPLGSPIYAVADGQITLTKALFFNGKSVFINHGFGIISMYFHLDSIAVESGQMISRGDIIGTVGSTGRSTGPHLHFGISMNNARVNPELFYADNQLHTLYNKRP